MAVEEGWNRGAELMSDTANEAQGELDLKVLFNRLLEKWKFIVGIALGCALVGLILAAFVLPAEYEATSKLYLVSSNAVVDISALQVGSSVSADYKEVIQNHTVHDRVKQEMGLDYTYKELNDMISLTTPVDTHILCISVTHQDVNLAVRMANTYATVAQQFIKERMDSRMPTLFEEAIVPEEKAFPRISVFTILGGFIGGVISCLVVLIRFLINDSIISADMLENTLGLNVLGVMPLEDADNGVRKKSQRVKNAAGAGK